MNFPHDICIIDLEINQVLQPDGSHKDGSVIELGAVWYRRDHLIHDTFEMRIESEEPLSEYIKTLCPHIESRYPFSLNTVLESFEAWIKAQNRSFIIGAWGNDHSYLLTYLKDRNLGLSDKLYRGLSRGVNVRHYMDMANVIYNKKPTSRGLFGMLNCWGLVFDGKQHQAMIDALNTAYLLDKVVSHKEKVLRLLGGK